MGILSFLGWGKRKSPVIVELPTDAHNRLYSPFQDMPRPTQFDLESAAFQRVYELVKHWDISVPSIYAGHTCGTRGHAKLILDAIRVGLRGEAQMYTADLKPCPHCGSEPWGLFGPEDDGRFWVECHGFKQDATSCGSWYASDALQSKEAVAQAWNERYERAMVHQPAPAPAVVLGRERFEGVDQLVDFQDTESPEAPEQEEEVTPHLPRNPMTLTQIRTGRDLKSAGDVMARYAHRYRLAKLTADNTVVVLTDERLIFDLQSDLADLCDMDNHERETAPEREAVKAALKEMITNVLAHTTHTHGTPS